MEEGTEASQFLLRAKDLTVSYDNEFQLQISDLEIPGRVFGLIGHNGAGKSTLIKALLDVLEPSTGSIVIQKGARSLSPTRDFAFCPETGSVFGDISVEQYLRLWCRIMHKDPSYYRHEASHILELLEVGPLLQRKGRELSKGQRRRVQTAVGFLLHPQFFLFDEPFDGLDVMRTAELSDIILHERERRGFLISSHRMDVIERACDAVVVLQEGRVVSAGPVSFVSSALGGVTYVVRVQETPSLHTERLRFAFPNSICTIQPKQLLITSCMLEEEALADILNRQGITPLSIEQRTPSLVDAVSLHLSSLDQTRQSAMRRALERRPVGASN